MEKVKVQFRRTIDTHISHVNPATEKNYVRRNMNDYVPILILLMKSISKQNVIGKKEGLKHETDYKIRI